MPATYAHWRFGRRCIDKMPDNLAKIVRENRDIFNFGVHGPDIFFYDLLHKDLTKYGYGMHSIPGNAIFKNFKQVYKQNNEKDAMMAYILGFLSHFTLDSMCHSYVEAKRQHENITHNTVESQLDYHWIQLDQRKPNLVDRSESLKPSKKIAKVISYFHPFDEKEVLRTTKLQKFVVKTLTCVTQRKYNAWQKFLHKFKADATADLFLGFEELSCCRDSNLRFDKLEVKALKLYPKLLNNLMNYFNDEEKLIDYFENNFCEKQGYRDIPILSYEEELNYEVK